jgi:hypothetical protein
VTGKESAVLRGAAMSPCRPPSAHDVTPIVTASGDKSARIWDAHVATMSTKDLVAEVCTRRLRGLTKLNRDEMCLAGYADSTPEIDVCAGIE